MNHSLSVQEVAEILAVSPQTIRRWARSGELPAEELPGGMIRIPRDDFEAWRQGRRIQPRRTHLQSDIESLRRL